MKGRVEYQLEKEREKYGEMGRVAVDKHFHGFGFIEKSVPANGYV